MVDVPYRLFSSTWLESAPPARKPNANTPLAKSLPIRLIKVCRPGFRISDPGFRLITHELQILLWFFSSYNLLIYFSYFRLNYWGGKIIFNDVFSCTFLRSLKIRRTFLIKRVSAFCVIINIFVDDSHNHLQQKFRAKVVG